MEKAIFIDNKHNTAQNLEPLKILKDTGFKLIAICTETGLQNLWSSEVKMDAFCYCNHYSGDCDCRTPQAGLLFEAAKTYQIELSESWMIGDTLDDIEAGNRAGCKTLLLANGNERQWQITPIRQPQLISPNFEYAAGAVVLKSIYHMMRTQS